MRRTIRPAGFTLIELMVTLTILGVVVALVAPGFSDSLQRSRLKAQGNDIVSLFELTKSEAASRHAVTTTIAVNGAGDAWSVSLLARRGDGSEELRTVSASSQVAMLTPTMPLATLPVTAGEVTGDFRGVFTGYVSSNNCRDGDRCIHLRSPGAKYELRIGINPVGQVVACAARASFGGFPAC